MNDDEGMRVDRSTKMLREMVLEKVRDAILNFQFQPGERLVERSLCDRLGVSRTVVREVLRYLEAEGLVESIPRQGPVVARPDPRQAAEIYEIRALLEAEAARSCALKATPGDIARLRAAIDRNEIAFAQGHANEILKGTTEFYEVMFACAQKNVAWNIVKSLNARINQLRAFTISTPGRGKAAIAEMRRLLEAIERADGEAAYVASMEHVQVASRLAQAALEAAGKLAPVEIDARPLPPTPPR